ncbi:MULTISPECIES: DUF1430 domain-containing protein [unclassified Clostridioides]|uniref:DUF1430 domain-containing protein n=1 Tax=unclassified Clostridioides TaxID=2635829 RepID=UPI001D107469|nr:DUF1430 domain-containing protein [Clostridioides sp. ES-S-0171-01]MCC0688239.1 DUF1430 domain-containing protein [Clostridioides sp. ES-S-0056-01]MCC0715850.1 DUF1430 domain-containing protein [Clostridioides sp. ES-S-0077-01]UDN54317.1 DUF1430 domain-containing protein [Clostridioides sp. ES-S-0054-01]
MKKILVLFLFIFSVFLYAVNFSQYDSEKANELNNLESTIASPFSIPNDGVLSSGKEMYQIIKKVSNNMNVNIYRTCTKANKNGEFEYVKYILINNKSTDFFKSIDIDNFSKRSNLEGNKFYGTENTKSKNQIGLIKDFGNNDKISIYDFNKLYENFPVAGTYSVELSDGISMSDFLSNLSTEINKNLNTNLKRSDLIAEETDEIQNKKANFLFQLCTFISAIVSILLIIFIIFNNSKQISIYKLHGIKDKSIWNDLFQKYINVSCFLFILFSVLISLFFGLPRDFISIVLFKQILYFILFSIISLVFYMYMSGCNINMNLKNKNSDIIIVIFNYTFKIVVVFILVTNCISLISNIDTLNYKLENLKNWNKVKDYGAIYPVLVGNDGLEKSETEINATEKLYNLLNKKGSIYIKSNLYEDDREKDKYFDGYFTLVVNPNYLEKFPIYNISNEKINVDENDTNWIVLIPEKYKYEKEKIMKYIIDSRKSIYDFEIDNFTGKKYDSILSQKIKIIWTKNDQNIFSFNPDVKKQNNNILKNEIIEVMTEKNSYPNEKYGIWGGGNTDPLKIKLKDNDAEKTYKSLLPYLNKWSLSDNYTTLINSNELILNYIHTLKYNIKNILTQIIVIIIVFAIIIFQNSLIIFQILKKKIIVKSIHGAGFLKIYGNILLILASTWIIQLAIEYLLSKSIKSNVMLIYIAFFIIEFLFTFLSISILKRKNKINILKGE